MKRIPYFLIMQILQEVCWEPSLVWVQGALWRVCGASWVRRYIRPYESDWGF